MPVEGNYLPNTRTSLQFPYACRIFSLGTEYLEKATTLVVILEHFD